MITNFSVNYIYKEVVLFSLAVTLWYNDRSDANLGKHTVHKFLSKIHLLNKNGGHEAVVETN